MAKKKSMHRPTIKQFTFLTAVVMTIVFVLMLIQQKSQGISSNQNAFLNSIKNTIPSPQSRTNTPLPTSTEPYSNPEWNTYTNTEFGFTLQYPPDIHVTPQNVDIIANYQEYIDKCDSGVYDGCGGGRWPDFKISFLRDNGKSAFDVRIYKLPMSAYFGGVERDSFTFIVQAFRYFGERGDLDPLDPDTLSRIQRSLKFIPPEKPLSCLWHWTINGPGFDAQKDKSYIEENKTKLTQISGYQYDAASNSCTPLSYYTWKEQTDMDKPPFTKLETCAVTCK